EERVPGDPSRRPLDPESGDLWGRFKASHGPPMVGGHRQRLSDEVNSPTPQNRRDQRGAKARRRMTLVADSRGSGAPLVAGYRPVRSTLAEPGTTVPLPFGRWL